MKLKFFFKSLLIILLISFSPCLVADEVGERIDYTRHIDFLAYRCSDTGTLVKIYLDDGLTWNLCLPLEYEYLLYDIDQNYLPGCEVYLSVDYNTAWYRLFVIGEEQDHVCYVGLTKESKAMLPSIVEIEKIKVSESGWFTSEKYEYVIEVSDGSKWTVNPESYLNHVVDLWRVGDKVIAGKDYFYEMNLMNVDVNYRVSDGDYRKVLNPERLLITL